MIPPGPTPEKSVPRPQEERPSVNAQLRSTDDGSGTCTCRFPSTVGCLSQAPKYRIADAQICASQVPKGCFSSFPVRGLRGLGSSGVPALTRPRCLIRLLWSLKNRSCPVPARYRPHTYMDPHNSLSSSPGGHLLSFFTSSTDGP